MTQDDSIATLKRFLYLGSPSNVFQSKNSIKDRHFVENLIEELSTNSQGDSAVQTILQIFSNNTTADPDILVLALAVCAKSRFPKTKAAAYQAFPTVCKASPNLFSFIEHSKRLSGPGKGWGRALRNAVNHWFNSKTPLELAHEVALHHSREGWTHKDLVKLAHVKSERKAISYILECILKGWKKFSEEKASDPPSDDPFIEQFKEFMYWVTAMKSDNVGSLQPLLDEKKEILDAYNFHLEYFSHAHQMREVMWLLMCPRLPLSPLLQKLPLLLKFNLLTPNTPLFTTLCDRLQNNKEPLDPVEMFFNLRNYCKDAPIGEDMAVDHAETTINPQSYGTLENCLCDLHKASLKSIPSTGKRILVAVDVSCTMKLRKIPGFKVLPSEVAAFLLMALVHSDGKQLVALSFAQNGLLNFGLTDKMKLDEVTKRMGEFASGPIDQISPIKWALEKTQPFDLFLILTDNIESSDYTEFQEALNQYRAKLKVPDSKFCLCLLNSNIPPPLLPDETNILAICGFNQKTLKIIQDFASGKF